MTITHTLFFMNIKSNEGFYLKGELSCGIYVHLRIARGYHEEIEISLWGLNKC